MSLPCLKCEDFESREYALRHKYLSTSHDLCSSSILILTRSLASVPESSPHPHGDIDEDQYYNLRTVLDERRIGRVTKYLIDWEDNPRTGEKYTPTWEPKENLTDVALADWKATKLANQAGMSRAVSQVRCCY